MQGGNEITGRLPMTCEEFALACLEVRSASGDSDLRQVALEHARQCPHCAALQVNLQVLQDDLRYLGLETKDAEAPARVEMRVMQEFRTRHRTEKSRRFALIGAWGLAAAAVLAAVVSWTSWRQHNNIESPTQVAKVDASRPTNSAPADGLVVGDALVASSSSGDFTLLPGSTPSPMEDATVVRVKCSVALWGLWVSP